MTASDPGQPDRLEGRPHPLVELAAAQAQVVRAEGDLRADPAGEDLAVGVLEDDAHEPGQVGDMAPADRLAADQDATLSGA